MTSIPHSTLPYRVSSDMQRHPGYKEQRHATIDQDSYPASVHETADNHRETLQHKKFYKFKRLAEREFESKHICSNY